MIELCSSDYKQPQTAKRLVCSYAALCTSVVPGSSVLVADGSLVASVFLLVARLLVECAPRAVAAVASMALYTPI